MTSRIHTVKKCDTETTGKFLSSEDNISNHTLRKDTQIGAQWRYSTDGGRGPECEQSSVLSFTDNKVEISFNLMSG